MKNLYILLFLIVTGNFYAQIPIMQNSNWTIANKGGLNFNPVQPIGSRVTFDNGFSSASVSDQDGNLLFYTDGQTVWNGDHSIMGTGLLGWGGDFSQSIVIIPDPLDINRYYIVTVSVEQMAGFHKGLLFSKVEMNGTTGTLTDINTPLLDNNGHPIDDSYPINYGKITTARHSNGLDYWLIAEIGSNVFSYLVDHHGITYSTLTPSPLDPTSIVNMNGMELTSSNGPIKMSLQNDKILIGYAAALDAGCSALGRLYCGLFDDTTGEITEYYEMNCSAASAGRFVAGAEFSEDGNTVHRLYDGGTIMSSTLVYDPIKKKWVEGTIIDSQKAPDPRVLQRGMDGKIYFENIDYSAAFPSYIGVINNPNAPNYDFQYNAVDVGSASPSNASIKLPTWVQWQPCHRFLITGNTITNPLNAERLIWIQATNKIALTSSGSVIYHAGNYVELNPGFETQNDSGFAAYIEGCSDNFLYKNGKAGEQVSDGSKSKFKSGNDFVIYPNPSNNVITVEIKNGMIAKVNIVSIDGKMVYQSNFENADKLQIDISSYRQGLYIVTVTSKDNTVFTEKLFKT